ncbi:hypothetical protein Hanom_Chr13g01206211 [Helianthus anomalus]
MKLAQSIVEEDEEVLNPATGKPYKNVRWHVTKETNIVPLLKELPNNSLKDLKFWMYDPLTGFNVFGENDIKLLAKTQIQSDPRQEVMAKTWTSGVAQILAFKLWSGQRSRVETQLFGPYVGRRLSILPEIIRKQKKPSKKRM